MPDWSRDVLPIDVSWPVMPTGLVSVGQSRKPQLRTTLQTGRMWDETYVLMKRADPRFAPFLAMVNDYWRNQVVFDIDHRGMRLLLGVGGGSPAISATGQSGSSVVVTGLPLSTANVFRRGDIIRLPGRTLVFDVTADVASDGAGSATVPINPPVFVGSSPTAGAVVTNATAGAVKFRAVIAEWEPPSAGVNEAYEGMTVKFAEMPG